MNNSPRTQSQQTFQKTSHHLTIYNPQSPSHSIQQCPYKPLSLITHPPPSEQSFTIDSSSQPSTSSSFSLETTLPRIVHIATPRHPIRSPTAPKHDPKPPPRPTQSHAQTGHFKPSLTARPPALLLPNRTPNKKTRLRSRTDHIRSIQTRKLQHYSNMPRKKGVGGTTVRRAGTC
jgi:hypothetical protein